MQALILAGGLGTRLRPLTINTPKPIVPVMNRPFLLFQIELLRRAGVTDIVLSLNYQPNKIQDLLGDGSEYGVSLRYLVEPEPLGTGGAYGFARDHISDSTVVLNGDILTDLDLAKMIARHRQTGATATIFLTPVADPSAYGLVETGKDSEVLRFREKPKPQEMPLLSTNSINAGIYLLEPEVLNLVPIGKNCSFEYDVFPGLLRDKKIFQAFTEEGVYWRDIGNPQSYLQAHQDFLAGRIRRYFSDLRDGSMVAPGCAVGDGTLIDGSVVGPLGRIGADCVIESSVIWEGANVGDGAIIKNSFLGRKCQVAGGCVVENEILGDETIVK
jgi:mannose-1-phosphate guanylyltransferase